MDQMNRAAQLFAYIGCSTLFRQTLFRQPPRDTAAVGIVTAERLTTLALASRITSQRTSSSDLPSSLSRVAVSKFCSYVRHRRTYYLCCTLTLSVDVNFSRNSICRNRVCLPHTWTWLLFLATCHSCVWTVADSSRWRLFSIC